VEGTLLVVGVGALAEELEVLPLVHLEVTRNVDGLAADNDDLVTSEELLGNNGRKAAEEVSTGVNDDRGHVKDARLIAGREKRVGPLRTIFLREFSLKWRIVH
jgi:hypothetical protein